MVRGAGQLKRRSDVGRRAVLMDFSLIAPGASEIYARQFLAEAARQTLEDVRVLLPGRDDFRDEQAALRAAGADVVVVHLPPPGTWRSRLLVQILLPLTVLRFRPRVTFVPRDLAPWVPRGEKVVLLHNMWRWVRADGVATNPVVWTLGHCAAVRSLNGARAVVAVSHTIAAAANPKRSVHIIPYGCDLPTGTCRDRPEAPVRVLALGVVRRHKAFHVAIDAVAALRERGVDATLRIAGSPSDSAEAGRLRRYSADRGLGEVLTGSVAPEDRSSVFDEGDIYLMTSGFESFGMPLVEAMRRGVVVVAPDVPIAREVCGDAALYFPRTDGVVVADVISRACRDYAALSARSIRRASDYRWDENVRRTLSLLRSTSSRELRATPARSGILGQRRASRQTTLIQTESRLALVARRRAGA